MAVCSMMQNQMLVYSCYPQNAPLRGSWPTYLHLEHLPFSISEGSSVVTVDKA
jgi:hypothetical protein